jgi:DNA-binding FadR family transcriptional regulator
MSAPFPHLCGAIYKQTAKEMVRDKIVSLIASGVLQLGDELPGEREFADMLLVSRETVRGAIQRLAGEGIVQVSHGSRTRVTKRSSDIGVGAIGANDPNAMNEYSLKSVSEARQLVETSLVSNATLRLTPDDIKRLEYSLEAQTLAARDPVRFLICDREFHLTVYYAAENRLLADFVANMYAHMMEQRKLVVSKAGVIERSLEDHRNILAALKVRDPEAASEAFRQHIINVYATSMALLQRRSQKMGGRG